jgi:hypothetical protein
VKSKEICDFCNSIFVVLLIVFKRSVLGDIINEGNMLFLLLYLFILTKTC